MRPAAGPSQLDEPRRLGRRSATLFELLPLLLLALAVGAVGTTAVDTGGVFPHGRQGPGPTLDEGFNVQQGTRLAVGLRAWLLGAISWRELFGEREDLGAHAPLGYHLPDHPPLGRLWLGIWHEFVRWCCPSATTDERFVFAYARVGSVWAFALTLFAVGWFTTRWFGPQAGFFGAACVAVQPRLFAHAHLAALETCTNLAYAVAILGIAHLWASKDAGDTDECGTSLEPEAKRHAGRISWQRGSGRRLNGRPDDEPTVPNMSLSAVVGMQGTAPPHGLLSVIGGALWGLVLLTKIQAVFVGVAVAAWAVFRWKRRAVVPLVVFTLAGIAIFFAGWPWLWLDPPSHFREYFARTTQRTSLHTWYAGRQWSDTRVPWHYPFVMFAVTVPVAVHAAAVVGLEQFARSWRFWGSRLGLVVLAILVPLVVFAVPGVAVYDGVRLFSVVFPLWAVPAGAGCRRLVSLADRRFGRRGANAAIAALVLALSLPACTSWRLWPCGLSYYNALVGGLRGARTRGFEITYWGDAVCREFLREITHRVPRGTRIGVVPVLHQYQLSELLGQCPLLKRHGVRVEPLDADIFNLSALYMPERRDPPAYVLVFRRKADLPTEWAELDAFGLNETQTQPVGRFRLHDVPRAWDGAGRRPRASERDAGPSLDRSGSGTDADDASHAFGHAETLEALLPQQALRRLFEPIVVFRRDGVWLAALLKLKAATRAGTR
ncbi:MAG: hypothetical protein D6725_09540 [Planctomycetota bacterium]|nr:MAG: hypothetical protein D6725_09540 [Planctomycetota bacterium]